MNPLSYFKGIEEQDSSRGDKNEGLHRFIQPEFANIKVDDHVVDNNDITKPVEIRRNKEQGVNLFCMYSIDFKRLKNNEFKLKLKREMHEFGDTGLIVLDCPEFFNRINTAIFSKNKELKNGMIESLGDGLVEYVDKNNYSGRMGLFKKFKNYSYQNEFRIALDVPESLLDTNDVFKLNIGDISDITKIFKTNEFEDIMEIRTE
ncbi:hypothetical protein [Halanaerobium sp. ST460_2HS_T2]|uniref:hypothetical protein n=1 Tax=Halanaerobium sp. ST460_2HS_T2 TaxID=2183914 RepID=UPI0011C06752|nr:hypothetical protein [Halanaerobium sp. ST460_2HS_T2]